MKSFFQHLMDSTVVFVAERYGFGYEEDTLKKEIRTLQYEHMLEKTKNMDETLGEVKELRDEVNRLKDEKISLLEHEVTRLQYENQQHKIGYKHSNALSEPSFSFNTVERFVYKEQFIKYVSTGGASNVAPLEQSVLLRYLQADCPDITFQLVGNFLFVSGLTAKGYQKKEFPLDQFISMITLRDFNAQSIRAKRTIE